MNRRIELHGKSFTISPAVSRPVLKVKDAKTKPEVGQSGSRGSRHVFCRIPTPPRMAEFPMTQDSTCGVLDPRHNTSSIGFLPVSVFTKSFFRITKKEVAYGCMFHTIWIPFHTISILFATSSDKKTCLFAKTALISKTDEGLSDLKDYFWPWRPRGFYKGCLFLVLPWRVAIF